MPVIAILYLCDNCEEPHRTTEPFAILIDGSIECETCGDTHIDKVFKWIKPSHSVNETSKPAKETPKEGEA